MKDHMENQPSSALRVLKKQIQGGKDIMSEAGSAVTEEQYDELTNKRSTWNKQNKLYLGEIYEGKYINIYRTAVPQVISFVGSYFDLAKETRELISGIKGSLQSLQAIYDMIAEIDINKGDDQSSTQGIEKGKIFIVHGHDTELKSEVKMLLQKLKLDISVLAEEPSVGNTIIEKLEQSAAQSSAAIVILSPDDSGYANSVGPTATKSRARQNVVLEMGLFMGKLGRKKVVAIYKEDQEFERPSDIEGLLYIPYSGDWKLKLASELKSRGFEIDLNLLTH